MISGIVRRPGCLVQRSTRLMSHISASNAPSVSNRIQETDAPVIALTKGLMATAKRSDVLSLAQGIVHWGPPPSALEKLSKDILTDPSLSGYGLSDGDLKLREALREKVRTVNGLEGYDIQVTGGANQAVTNIVCALLDSSDRAVLFAPLYFNHAMALQMTGGGGNIVLGESDPRTLHPSLDWLERECSGPRPPKLVIVTNPSNPTGVLMARAELDRLAEITRRAGAWLVMDNTYEDFCYGSEHYTPSGPHVLAVFSFSKAYGMMGWRIGYIAYPSFNGQLGPSLLKVQDTIPICPSSPGQRLALYALEEEGRAYMRENIRGLEANRAAVRDALSPLGPDKVHGGDGAIYFFCGLPKSFAEGERDVDAVKWLINKHGVTVIPGSACKAPGNIRVAYANLSLERTRIAAARLREGLTELVKIGHSGVKKQLEEMGLQSD